VKFLTNVNINIIPYEQLEKKYQVKIKPGSFIKALCAWY
jgi:hypothetical protein